MVNMFTVRNLPKGALERLRTYARKHNLKTGEALAYIIRRGIEAEDESKPYSLKDFRNFMVKGKHKDGSMRVDEIVYGVKRR